MIKLKSCDYFFCVFQYTRFAEHPPAIARATQFACLSRRWHHQRGGRCLRHMSWRGFWGRGRSAVLWWMQFVRTSLLLWARGFASRLLVLHAVWICIRWELVLYFYISFVFDTLYSKFNPVKRRKRKLHFLQVPKRIWNWRRLKQWICFAVFSEIHNWIFKLFIWKHGVIFRCESPLCPVSNNRRGDEVLGRQMGAHCLCAVVAGVQIRGCREEGQNHWSGQDSWWEVAC